MFVHRGRVFKGLAAILCAVLLLASGCGSEDSAGPSEPAPEAETEQTPGVGTSDADPGDVRVISEWIAALSEGDVEAAAGYFATPSIAENGPLVIPIQSRSDAIDFNRTLPCGGEVIEAQTEGDFTTATFRLTGRPGGGCGAGTGGTASTSFVIEDGLIVEWRRLYEAPAEEPGEGPGRPV